MQSSNVHKIDRGALVGFLLRLFGNWFRGLRLSEDALVLLARRPREVPFLEMTGPAQVARAFFCFYAISLPLAGGSKLKVVVDRFEFVGSRDEQRGGGGGNYQQSSPQQSGPPAGDPHQAMDEGDIPF